MGAGIFLAFIGIKIVEMCIRDSIVPIIGDENMIQEMPEEFNKVLEVQKSWKK